MVSPRRFDFPPLTQKSRSFTEDQRPRRKPAVSGKDYLFKKAEVIHRDSMFRFLDNHAVYVQRFNDLGTPRARSNSRDRALFSRGLTPVKYRAASGRASAWRAPTAAAAPAKAGASFERGTPAPADFMNSS